jgi:hypothetical protein
MSAFLGDSNDIQRPLSMSFREVAEMMFKKTVERSHLYDRGPLFAALGRFILDDGYVLQCVAYQNTSVPENQFDMPALGNCDLDLGFHFSIQSGDALNPFAPHWIAAQECTDMSTQMKQVLWSLSRVLSNAVDAGFFTCLHQIRELRTVNGALIPVHSLIPGDSDATVLPHHKFHFLFDLNQRFWPQILKLYQEVSNPPSSLTNPR